MRSEQRFVTGQSRYIETVGSLASAIHLVASRCGERKAELKPARRGAVPMAQW
jgi:hypothetical protein